MATFELNSSIRIGKYEIKGVQQIEIKKSIYSLVETATIKIPSKAQIRRKSDREVQSGLVSVFELIPAGTPVTISLGYNGRYKEEFKGFVESVNGGAFLTVNCVGYVWQLRKNVINKFWKQTTLKELLTEVVKGTDITFQLNTEIKVEKLFVRDGNGASLLNDIVERIGGGYITAFFIEPNVLWVGLRYTGVRNSIKYKLGYNTISDDLTQEAIEPASVTLIYKKPNGKRVYAKTRSIGSKEVRITTSYTNDKEAVSEITKWAEQKNNKDSIRGEIKTLLEPYCQPGDKAIVLSNRYPHKAGEYIIESTKVLYGSRGAYRTFEIGQKVGVIDAETTVKITDSEQEN